jgi:hypothetical protein
MPPDRTGPIQLGTYATDDGSAQVVLNNGGEFNIVLFAASYSPTGSFAVTSGEMLTMSCSDDEKYIFKLNGGSLIFESGEWLENWVAPGTVFTLTEHYAGIQTTSPTDSQQGQTPTASEPLCPYTSFRFESHMYYSRKIEDSAFTAEVWNALRFDEWEEIIEDAPSWESNERLSFYSGDEQFCVRLLSTSSDGVTWDEALVVKPLEVPGYYETVAYYKVPAGTCVAVDTMISDYIVKNFKYDFSPQILSDLIYSSEYVHFIKHKEADFFVQSSSVGRFMDEWNMDSWEEIVLPDGTERLMDERVISIIGSNRYPGAQIIVNLDYLEATVYYEWGTPTFRINLEIADIIERQFSEFQELAF